jgi:secondary thiamine-phosphate synthase enzyme
MPRNPAGPVVADRVTFPIMQSKQTSLIIPTDGQALLDITAQVSDWVSEQRVATGMLNLFCRHTSASLVIQENADEDVLRDLQSFFQILVPEQLDLYRHQSEGADDMPAHIKSALTSTSLNIPVRDGRPLLGTWQAIYLFEHRRQPHRRELVLHYMGD